MPKETLTARVARLEKAVAELVSRMNSSPEPGVGERQVKRLHQPGRDDWMTVVGMFGEDEVMKRIDAQGAAIRRAERRNARQV